LLHNNSFNTYYNWYWLATTLVTTTKEKVKKRRGDKEEKLITTNPRRMVKVSLPWFSMGWVLAGGCGWVCLSRNA
jgi:hypothetical protein